MFSQFYWCRTIFINRCLKSIWIILNTTHILSLLNRIKYARRFNQQQISRDKFYILKMQKNISGKIVRLNAHFQTDIYNYFFYTC